MDKNKNKNKKLGSLEATRAHPSYKKWSAIFGARLRLAVEIYDGRAARGWSQQELATAVGTTQKVISKIESADTNVGFELLRKIAGQLNLSLRVGKMAFVNGTDATASH